MTKGAAVHLDKGHLVAECLENAVGLILVDNPRLELGVVPDVRRCWIRPRRSARHHLADDVRGDPTYDKPWVGERSYSGIGDMAKDAPDKDTVHQYLRRHARYFARLLQIGEQPPHDRRTVVPRFRVSKHFADKAKSEW